MSAVQFEKNLARPDREDVDNPINGVFVRDRALGKMPSRSSLSSEKKVVEETDAEAGGLAREGDVRKRQKFSGKLLFWLAYQSIGVIYGDIGTSPLYVFSSTFSSQPSYDDLLGALSLIIWSVTLIVSVKYIFIILYADDEGEGGTFAVYSLLSRYANIVKRDPKEESMVKIERYATNDLRRSNRAVRSGMEKSKIVRILLKVVGVLGVSLVMSDGVLTPAQSVLGAIQGLNVATPNMTTSTIVGVSCAILILLFLIQPLGTSKLASAFAPIVIVWLLFNFAFGIYNLVMFDHSVLRAFSPSFAGAYLVRNGESGWRSLGGILLAFTGCEAMFADIGAFTRPAVQLSWMCFTYPCLMLAYIGQAAYISSNAGAYSNPFFNSVPPGMFYPSLVVAILAAIVASQAMITSTFQLLGQVMKLSYFPQVKLVHTSKTFHGQIYIPMANWLLMIGTVIVTAVYNNTTSLGNAYGTCVIIVTFISTCMVSLVALIIWRVNPVIVFSGFLVFGALDGTFLSSVLTKVPEGAWFTLMLALVLSSVFILWRFGKENQWRAEAEDRFKLTHLITAAPGGTTLQLTLTFGGAPLTNTKGFSIFLDKAGDVTPTVFIQFAQKLMAIPDVMVWFHLRPLSTPSVPEEDRFTITRLPIPNAYRLVVRHGYTDEIVTEDLSALVFDKIRTFIIREAYRRPSLVEPAPARIISDDLLATSAEPSSSSSEIEGFRPTTIPHGVPEDQVDDVASRLAHLSSAYATQVLYIMGKEQMRIRNGTGMFRRLALNSFLWVRENTRSKMANLKIPVQNLVEVGFVKEV